MTLEEKIIIEGETGMMKLAKLFSEFKQENKTIYAIAGYSGNEKTGSEIHRDCTKFAIRVTRGSTTSTTHTIGVMSLDKEKKEYSLEVYGTSYIEKLGSILKNAPVEEKIRIILMSDEPKFHDSYSTTEPYG